MLVAPLAGFSGRHRCHRRLGPAGSFWRLYGKWQKGFCLCRQFNGEMRVCSVSRLNRSLSSDAKVAAVVSGVFVVFQVQMSLRAGTLGLPPTYDDVGYFVDAATRLSEFLSGGLAKLARGYFANPPHAPGSTFLACVGFMLLGMSSSAAAMSNAIPLFFVSFLLLRLFRTCPRWVASLTVSLLLLIPIFGLAIVEFRPDMWCAIFTVIGTLFIAMGDVHEHKRRAVYAGIAFAAALLMKPTFSPMVLILFSAATVLRCVPLARQRTDWSKMAHSVGFIWGIPLALAGPHFVFALPRLVDYYRLHVFGSESAVWSPNLTLTAQLLYYVTGPGGSPTIGPWILPSAATIAIPFWLWRRRQWSALWIASSILILTLLAYAIVTIPGNKSPYLGMVVPAYLAGGVAISTAVVLHELYARGAHRTAVAICAAMFAFAVVTYRVPWTALHGPQLPPGFASDRFEVLDRVTNAISGRPGFGSEKVLFTQIGQYLNPTTLTFRLQQVNRPVPEFLENYMSRDIQTFPQFFGRATYVVAMTPDNSSVLNWLPSAKIASQIFEQIVPSGFELISEIPESGGTGQVRIYRRVN